MRVVIAEDSALLREGLSRLLVEAGFDVVASVADGESVIRVVAEHQPDLVVLDVRMPPTFTDEGYAPRSSSAASGPRSHSWCSPSTSRSVTRSKLLAGQTRGIGYLLKDRVADVDEFVEALRKVGAGGTVLDPDVVAQLLARSRHAHPLAKLSPREREVLALMAEGRSNAAIAAELVVGRGRRGKARHQHLREAGPAARRLRPSPGARRPALPRELGAVMTTLRSTPGRIAAVAIGVPLLLAAIGQSGLSVVALLDAYERNPLCDLPLERRRHQTPLRRRKCPRPARLVFDG